MLQCLRHSSITNMIRVIDKATYSLQSREILWHYKVPVELTDCAAAPTQGYANDQYNSVVGLVIKMI